ncbi:MAG TPA: Vms1/Ankzf1 family peptidyl-tRNA hydrolase [Methanothrix sp.]|nr:Vms1/Ankzf1 family peptidyl-tRNA hydrolase [Methanothrix sp.]
MVDLFGKKKLADRIHELEFSMAELRRENEELVRTLEKREEKIRKLASAYQEAKLALKATEQRMAASTAAGTTILEERRAHPPGTRLSIREMEGLMRRLQTCRSPMDDLLTAFLPDNSGLPPEAERYARAVKSTSGWVFLRYPQLFTLLLVPPFPILECSSAEGSTFQLDHLRDLMEMPVLVVSAHAGDTLLGVAFGRDAFEVQEFVESQVKEKHSKGGWSQKRFERLREEDVSNHIEAVLQRLAEFRAKYASVVKYAVLGGDQSLMKQIAPALGLPVVERRLDRHDEKRLDRLLDEVYGFKCYRIEQNGCDFARQ